MSFSCDTHINPAHECVQAQTWQRKGALTKAKRRNDFIAPNRQRLWENIPDTKVPSGTVGELICKFKTNGNITKRNQTFEQNS